MSKVNIYDIEGLPFSTEGYERAQDLSKTKFDKTSKTVNAYMKNIMGQPTLHDSKPKQEPPSFQKRHRMFTVQSLETLGKLEEVSMVCEDVHHLISGHHRRFG